MFRLSPLPNSSTGKISILKVVKKLTYIDSFLKSSKKGISLYLLATWPLLSDSRDGIFTLLRSPESIQRNQFLRQAVFSLGGRYDNPIPTRFLAPIDCLKIPAPVYLLSQNEEAESKYIPSPLIYSKQLKAALFANLVV